MIRCAQPGHPLVGVDHDVTGCARVGAGSTVAGVIREVAELRAFGQVCPRVAELDIDMDTGRAGMRRAACCGGMRIRTVVVEATDTADYLDEHGCPLPAGALVYAVRTDLPPDRATWVAPPTRPPAATNCGTSGATASLPTHRRSATRRYRLNRYADNA
jgi:hypothetical protein